MQTVPEAAPRSCDGGADRIYYDVPVWGQGMTNLCWAFAEYEVTCFREGKPGSLQGARRYADERSLQTYKPGEHKNPHDHLGAPRCTRIASGAESVGQLCAILRENGPIYAQYRRLHFCHFVVVTGADAGRGCVYVNNSWGKGGRYCVSFDRFLRTCPRSRSRRNRSASTRTSTSS